MSAAAAITLENLSLDPYPSYAALRREQPVAWIPSLGMWWVTRYEDVREVLLDADAFVTGTDASLVFDTFGEHMLTSEGDRHKRYRDARMNAAFMPASLDPIRSRIRERTSTLIAPLLSQGRADLRRTVGRRLPVLVMLDLFGLPDSAEGEFRVWYDAFEAALSNHGRDPAVRARASASVSAFHAFLQPELNRLRGQPDSGFLGGLLARPIAERLSDEEIRRNALIIMFGGISTVEAVTLNLLWSLLRHDDAFQRIQADRALLDVAFDESMRWMSPVQSATRHALKERAIAGVRIPAGATVNCMIASANRDEAVFDEPDTFDIDRTNARKHLGFATGPHLCLGRHLAREEALAAVSHLLDSTRNLRLTTPFAFPAGHEFRQPPCLWLEWDQA